MAKPESSQYSSRQYLTARASGQSEPEARRRALSALSGIFESEISSRVRAETRSVISSRHGEHLEKNVEETIRIQSSVQLEGAKIGDSWKSDGLWHAIAVLDRAKARQQWISELKQIDNSLAGSIRAYHELNSPVRKLRAIDRIMNKWLEKQAVQSRMRVIGAHYDSRIKSDIADIVRKLPQIKSSMRIFIDISGARSRTVQDRISRHLTEEGYILTDAESKADVIIKGRTRVAPVDLDRGKWEFVRASITASILDKTTGDRVANVSKDCRAAHLNVREATRKAIEEVSGKAAREIGDQFVSPEEK
ncbi:MAG: LPP20 family lipoprotein [Desulfosalsimonadaceae bacterium]